MNITWKELETANKTISTTDIKGKAYAEVNQRIKAFRMVYPTGIITTEMVSNENGVCIFRATVGYKDEDKVINVLAEGTAYEKENSSFINKTSYIENCETSAIGRALGIAGFGIDTSVASADEVQNAIANQQKPSQGTNSSQNENKAVNEPVVDETDNPIDARKVKLIKAKLQEKNISEQIFCERYKITKVEELTDSKFGRAVNAIDKSKPM
jgi:hypothetical protein